LGFRTNLTFEINVDAYDSGFKKLQSLQTNVVSTLLEQIRQEYDIYDICLDFGYAVYFLEFDGFISLICFIQDEMYPRNLQIIHFFSEKKNRI
jgi:hypothetical protein